MGQQDVTGMVRSAREALTMGSEDLALEQICALAPVWKDVSPTEAVDLLERAATFGNAPIMQALYESFGEFVYESWALALALRCANEATARFLLDGDFTRLNGYAIEWTNLVPSNLTKGTSSQVCSAMIFGNFEDLFIGEWGGLDIVVDPYTKAGSGEVVMTVNAWNDVLVAQPKSFAKIVDLTTNA